MSRDYREEARADAARRHEEKTLNPPSRARSTRKKRPRRVLGIWMRVSLLVVFIGMLAFMAFRLVVKVIHPYREEGAQTAQLRGNRAEASDLDIQNIALRQKITYLKTPYGMAREARKMGYVRPGEIPFVVEGLMPSTLPAAPASTVKTAAPASNSAVRLWHRLTGRTL